MDPFKRFEEIQSRMSVLDDKYKDTISKDIPQEVHKERKDLEDEEITLVGQDLLVKKAYIAKKCDLALGRWQETKQQREYREYYQNIFPEHVDLPDLLDYPKEFRFKIGTTISALSTIQAELVDLLTDKYQSIV